MVRTVVVAAALGLLVGCAALDQSGFKLGPVATTINSDTLAFDAEVKVTNARGDVGRACGGVNAMNLGLGLWDLLRGAAQSADDAVTAEASGETAAPVSSEPGP